MRHIIAILFIFILIVSSPLSILALEDEDGSNQKIKRWTVSLYWGGTGGGPAKDTENALRKAGFYGGTGGSFFGLWGGQGEGYPRTTRGDSSMFEASYNVRSFFAVGLITSKGDLGETYGTHIEAHGLDDPKLSVKHSIMTIAPIFSFQETFFRLGVGPAFYKVSSNNGRSQNKVGLIFDIGLVIPRKSRFFVEIKWQYRFIGKSEIGSYEVGGAAVSTGLPQFTVSLNHWFLGLGLGVRL